MKKIIFLLIAIAGFYSSSIQAQDSVAQGKLKTLLTHYFNIKNALVAGDAPAAVDNANLFINTANTIDYKMISEGNLNALLNDATVISETKDLKKQRLFFSSFSANMIAIAKQVKLTDVAIYEAYCPMKKASWLSTEKEIRNPYYGNAMLTCGKVTATIEHK